MLFLCRRFFSIFTFFPVFTLVKIRYAASSLSSSTKQPPSTLWQKIILAFLVIFSCFSFSLSANTANIETACDFPKSLGRYANSQETLRLRPLVIAKYQKPLRYTQGLVVDNQFIYESNGLYGKSAVIKYRLPNFSNLGNTVKLDEVKTLNLPSFIFAEGMTLVGNRLILLSWKERSAFFIKKSTLSEVAKVPYSAEGWGIAAEKIHGQTAKPVVVTSDGSDTLTWREPKSLALLETRRVVLQKVGIRRGKEKLLNFPVYSLNELEIAPLPIVTAMESADDKQLEHFPSYILANVWGSDFIAVISREQKNIENLKSLVVVAEIDLREISRENKTPKLLQKKWGVLEPVAFPAQYEFTANGIAFIAQSPHCLASHFLLTGKNWRFIYRVRFLPIE